MSTQKSQLGLIGLGTMGRNLLLNMADSGYAVAGYDKDPGQVKTLEAEAGNYAVRGAASAEAFAGLLAAPRAILLLVPAGKIVDSVIEDLLPHLSPGDLIIDGGNSHFSDTDRRQKQLAKKDIHFLGLGISGGAEGARRGPSMMPGGTKEAWEQVRDILEATAARVDGEPCVAWLGEGSAGHYVKMVHNGIEYGLMQLLAETYDLLRRGLGLTNEEIGQTFYRWNQGELNSYLVEITARIFQQPDDRESGLLIDRILDKSKQKGTGKWTSQNAMDIGTAVPVIDLAVVMRILSGAKEERTAAAAILSGPDPDIKGDRSGFVSQLQNALYFSFVVTYAQGMAQLRTASEEYGYDLHLQDVARIWRGGCIIRAALLEDIRQAYRKQPGLSNLLVADQLSEELNRRQADLRAVVAAAAKAGLPVPGLMTALAYFDAYRSERLPANLIQAQRDYFGSHTYERTDRPGSFHTEWG